MATATLSRQIVYECTDAWIDKAKEQSFGGSVSQDMEGTSYGLPLHRKSTGTIPTRHTDKTCEYYTSGMTTSVVLTANIIPKNGVGNDRSDTGSLKMTNGTPGGATIASATVSAPRSDHTFNLTLSGSAHSNLRKGGKVTYDDKTKDPAQFPEWAFLTVIDFDMDHWHVKVGSGDPVKLVITITYKYELPSINSITKFTASSKSDNYSRKVGFSWNYVGWNGGHKPTSSQTKSTGVIYEIRDTSDANKILYKSDLVTNTSGSKSTDEYPLIFLKEGESARKYTLTAYLNNHTSKKTVSDPAATASVYAPVIDGWQAPPNESPIRFILQNSDDETMQDISHSGGILTGDSLVIQWAKPKIKYANELYVNFQVLLSKNKKDFEVIHWHYANKTNCPQVKSDSIELNDKGYDETNDDYYKYQYVFNKEEMRRHNVQNYERVYLAIRPVIVGKYNGVIFNGNESGNITWRNGATTMAFDNTINSTTNAKAGMVPTPSQYDWQDFICVFECNVSYCPDGFKWVKCLMYYCSDGISWKPVIARWSPDGSYWVYC